MNGHICFFSGLTDRAFPRRFTGFTMAADPEDVDPVRFAMGTETEDITVTLPKQDSGCVDVFDRNDRHGQKLAQ